jgi:tetratricopeptide (TPR) repeat protein
MKLKFHFLFLIVLTLAWLANPAAAQTNFVATNAPNDSVANGYLQVQEQLHAARLAIEENRQIAVDEAKKNSEALALRLQSLELAVSAQHNSEAESARKTQQLTLMLAGAFGLVGLGIMLLMVYFQWRAFSQIAEISAQQNSMLANASAVHQLAAPGRATVEVSNARLLDVVGQLEKKIHDLESGGRLLADTAPAKPVEGLSEADRLLDANQPQKALAVLEKFLTAQPRHANALLKRGVTLEKLGQLEVALASCDQAIAADKNLTMAYLQKGGLLNKLNRHPEALDCFEQALLAQDKKGRAA